MADERFQVVIGATDQASPVLQKFQNELAGTQKQTKGLVTGLQALADKSKWAFAAMSGAVVGVTKVYADFEDVMAKVATQLPGEAMEHYEEFTRAVQDMSIEFGQSTTVMAQGLYDILSAAIEPEKALLLLEQSAKTAAAGFTDVATTADLFTSILNAYGMEVEDAAHISDVLFQSVFRGKMEFEDMATELGSIMGVAAQAGVSLEDLGASLATLTRSGIDTAEAVTGIRQAILSYIDPGKEALETAAALGIEFNSTALQTDGLINSIAKLTGATQEQLSALFPNVRALVAVQGILGDLNGALEDYALNQNAAETTTEAFAKATDTMKFSIDQLKSSVQVLTQEFVEAAAPAINEILESFRGWVQVLRDMDEEQKRVLGELFLTLTKMVGLVAGMNLLGKAIMGIGTALGVSASILSPWILAIEGIIAAIVLLDHYKDRLIPFFEELGEKVGLLNEEMTEFYGHTIDLDPQIETLKKQISDTNLEIIKMEEEFIKLDEAGLFPNPEMLQRYQQLNTQLNEAQMEYDRLTAAQPDYIEGIIKEKEEVQKLKEQLDEESKALDVVTPKVDNLGDKHEEAAERVSKLENALQRLSDISYETEWGISLINADDVTSQVLSIQKQYEDTMKEIEGIVAEFPELADEADKAILLLSTKTSLDIENVYKEARNRLKEMTSEAEFAADLIGMDEYEKQLAQLEKELNTKLADIAKYPPQLAKEAQQATLAVWKEYLASIGEISLQRAEDEKKRIEEETKAEEEKIDEIIKLEREKNDKITQLNNEILKSTGRNLEALVQEHRTKYAEIVNLFDWTNDELKEIQAIAITDLTQQVTDYADSYISEMIRTGASSEEITNAIEGIIFVLEKLKVGPEVISQLRQHFEELPPVIEESKVAVEDLIGVLSDVGDLIIGIQFGEAPTAGQIGGVVGGILGLFSGIPNWIAGLVDTIFGWIDQIQQRTQEMIDGISSQLESAFTDFFTAPTLQKATQNFGENLHAVVYEMVLSAVVEAILASEVMRDAIEKLGKAINEYMKTGSLEGLIAGMSEFESTVLDKVYPLMIEIYPYLHALAPTSGTAPATQTFSGSVPSYQSGGYVPKTGLALLHEGEYVIPKEESRAISFGNVEITINTTGGVDGADLWEEFEREARRRGVALVS